MANFQSSSPLSNSNNVWRLLLLFVGVLLIVLITIDIYIRVLLPPDTTGTILSSKTKNPKSYHASTRGGAHTVGSVFRPIEALENLGPVGDGAWDSILSPERGGFLYVKSNDSSAGPEPWGVGMFHSLHCLGMLRAVIQKQEGLTTGEMDHEHHLTPHISDDNHAKHCLSYLAQVSRWLSSMWNPSRSTPFRKTLPFSERNR
jgi:hypothetical protein